MYLPSFIVKSANYSITLTGGVLEKALAITPVSQYGGAISMYQIVTNSVGDGVGQSDMAAEGWLTLDGPSGSDWTTVTAHRAVDNMGSTNTTYYFSVIEFANVMLRQAVLHNAQSGIGPRSFLLHRGQARGGTGVLPNVYKGGFQYDCVDPR